LKLIDLFLDLGTPPFPFGIGLDFFLRIRVDLLGIRLKLFPECGNFLAADVLDSHFLDQDIHSGQLEINLV
jgi:hypothetical protein